MTKSQIEQQAKADAFLLKDAQFLLNALKDGLPSGETPDTVAEILALRIRQLEEMKPCQGRGGLIIDLTNHLNKYVELAKPEPAPQPESAPVQESDGKQSTLL